MIAKIIPLMRLGRRCHFFDYALPESLESQCDVGQLVSIHFRKKKCQGIVWKIEHSTDTARECKSIETVVKKHTYLSNAQMAFLEWFAGYYYVSLSHAASTFIPQQPVRSSRKTKDHSIQLPHITPQTINEDDLLSRKSILVSLDWNTIFSLLETICKKAVASSKQILVITPSLHDAKIVYAFLTARFIQDVVLASGDTNKSVLANAYDLLAQEMCHIAVSTRMALGWNLPALDRIILIHPESRDYKQYDKNPRYDTRAIADYIADMRNVSITHLTACPSAEMVERSDRTHTRIVSPSAAPYTSASLVNLSNDLRNGNYSFLSIELQRAMKNALEAKRGVFLFLNRKGYGGLVRCNQCAYVFMCTDCMLPQRYSMQYNTLRCTICQKKETLAGVCTNCRSHNLAFPGIGIEKIARSVKILFPDASIVEMSAESPLSDETLKNIAESIIIGTSHFLQNHWERCSQLGFIGIIAADPLQSLSDFRSLEYQWQNMANIFCVARTFDIPIVIQSFDPSSIPMQTLISGDWRTFCNWQLEQRKRFSWPPYSRIIKIIARHHTLQIPNAMQTLMKTLQVALAPIKDTVTIFRASTMRFEDRPYLLIRINKPSRSIDPLPHEIEVIIPALLDDWLIDIDPMTF